MSHKFVDRLEEGAISFLLAAMTLITFLEVILRYVFNTSILWGIEASTYLFAWLVLFGMSAAYPDVQVADYIKPEATPIYEEVVARCWTSKDFLVNVLDVALNQQSIWAQSPLDGALGARVAENVPTERITTPLLVAQGGADTLVLPEVQQEYVASLCQAGQELDFRVYDGKNHLSVVQDGSPLLDDLMTWTEERLAGKLAQNTC